MEQRTLVKAVRGRVGLIRLERVRVVCPACHQQVEAVARDGRVKGYCTIAGRYVDFPVETPGERDARHRGKLSEAIKKRWQDPEYRARISAIRKKRWQDPEYRAKVIEPRKKNQQHI